MNSPNYDLSKYEGCYDFMLPAGSQVNSTNEVTEFVDLSGEATVPCRFQHLGFVIVSHLLCFFVALVPLFRFLLFPFIFLFHSLPFFCICLPSLSCEFRLFLALSDSLSLCHRVFSLSFSVFLCL